MSSYLSDYVTRYGLDEGTRRFNQDRDYYTVHPSTRYLGLVEKYQQQHLANVSSSGTMYGSPSGGYYYVSGDPTKIGTRFTPNVLTLAQEQAIAEVGKRAAEARFEPQGVILPKLSDIAGIESAPLPLVKEAFYRGVDQGLKTPPPPSATKAQAIEPVAVTQPQKAQSPLEAFLSWSEGAAEVVNKRLEPVQQAIASAVEAPFKAARFGGAAIGGDILDRATPRTKDGQKFVSGLTPDEAVARSYNLPTIQLGFGEGLNPANWGAGITQSFQTGRGGAGAVARPLLQTENLATGGRFIAGMLFGDTRSPWDIITGAPARGTILEIPESARAPPPKDVQTGTYIGKSETPKYSPVPGSATERFAFDEYGQVLGYGGKFEPALSSQGVPNNTKMGNGEYEYVGEYTLPDGEVISRYINYRVGSYVDFGKQGIYTAPRAGIRQGGSPGATANIQMPPEEARSQGITLRVPGVALTGQAGGVGEVGIDTGFNPFAMFASGVKSILTVPETVGKTWTDITTTIGKITGAQQYETAAQGLTPPKDPSTGSYVGKGNTPKFSPEPGSATERFAFDEYGKVLGYGGKFEPALSAKGIPHNTKMGNGEYEYVGEYALPDGEIVSRYINYHVGSYVDFGKQGIYTAPRAGIRAGGSPGATDNIQMPVLATTANPLKQLEPQPIAPLGAGNLPTIIEPVIVGAPAVAAAPAQGAVPQKLSDDKIIEMYYPKQEVKPKDLLDWVNWELPFLGKEFKSGTVSQMVSPEPNREAKLAIANVYYHEAQVQQAAKEFEASGDINAYAKWKDAYDQYNGSVKKLDTYIDRKPDGTITYKPGVFENAGKGATPLGEYYTNRWTKPGESGVGGIYGGWELGNKAIEDWKNWSLAGIQRYEAARDSVYNKLSLPEKAASIILPTLGRVGVGATMLPQGIFSMALAPVAVEYAIREPGAFAQAVLPGTVQQGVGMVELAKNDPAQFAGGIIAMAVGHKAVSAVAGGLGIRPEIAIEETGVIFERPTVKSMILGTGETVRTPQMRYTPFLGYQPIWQGILSEAGLGLESYKYKPVAGVTRVSKPLGEVVQTSRSLESLTKAVRDVNLPRDDLVIKINDVRREHGLPELRTIGEIDTAVKFVEQRRPEWIAKGKIDLDVPTTKLLGSPPVVVSETVVHMGGVSSALERNVWVAENLATKIHESSSPVTRGLVNDAVGVVHDQLSRTEPFVGAPTHLRPMVIAEGWKPTSGVMAKLTTDMVLEEIRRNPDPKAYAIAIDNIRKMDAAFRQWKPPVVNNPIEAARQSLWMLGKKDPADIPEFFKTVNKYKDAQFGGSFLQALYEYVRPSNIHDIEIYTNYHNALGKDLYNYFVQRRGADKVRVTPSETKTTLYLERNGHMTKAIEIHNLEFAGKPGGILTQWGLPIDKPIVIDGIKFMSWREQLMRKVSSISTLHEGATGWEYAPETPFRAKDIGDVARMYENIAIAESFKRLSPFRMQEVEYWTDAANLIKKEFEKGTTLSSKDYPTGHQINMPKVAAERYAAHAIRTYPEHYVHIPGTRTYFALERNVVAGAILDTIEGVKRPLELMLPLRPTISNVPMWVEGEKFLAAEHWWGGKGTLQSGVSHIQLQYKSPVMAIMDALGLGLPEENINPLIGATLESRRQRITTTMERIGRGAQAKEVPVEIMIEGAIVPERVTAATGISEYLKPFYKREAEMLGGEGTETRRATGGYIPKPGEEMAAVPVIRDILEREGRTMDAQQYSAVMAYMDDVMRRVSPHPKNVESVLGRSEVIQQLERAARERGYRGDTPINEALLRPYKEIDPRGHKIGGTTAEFSQMGVEGKVGDIDGYSQFHKQIGEAQAAALAERLGKENVKVETSRSGTVVSVRLPQTYRGEIVLDPILNAPVFGKWEKIAETHVHEMAGATRTHIGRFSIMKETPITVSGYNLIPIRELALRKASTLVALHETPTGEWGIQPMFGGGGLGAPRYKDVGGVAIHLSESQMLSQLYGAGLAVPRLQALKETILGIAAQGRDVEGAAVKRYLGASFVETPETFVRVPFTKTYVNLEPVIAPFERAAGRVAQAGTILKIGTEEIPIRKIVTRGIEVSEDTALKIAKEISVGVGDHNEVVIAPKYGIIGKPVLKSVLRHTEIYAEPPWVTVGKALGLQPEVTGTRPVAGVTTRYGVTEIIPGEYAPPTPRVNVLNVIDEMGQPVQVRTRLVSGIPREYVIYMGEELPVKQVGADRFVTLPGYSREGVRVRSSILPERVIPTTGAPLHLVDEVMFERFAPTSRTTLEIQRALMERGAAEGTAHADAPRVMRGVETALTLFTGEKPQVLRDPMRVISENTRFRGAGRTDIGWGVVETVYRADPKAEMGGATALALQQRLARGLSTDLDFEVSAGMENPIRNQVVTYLSGIFGRDNIRVTITEEGRPGVIQRNIRGNWVDIVDIHEKGFGESIYGIKPAPSIRVPVGETTIIVKPLTTILTDAVTPLGYARRGFVGGGLGEGTYTGEWFVGMRKSTASKKMGDVVAALESMRRTTIDPIKLTQIDRALSDLSPISSDRYPMRADIFRRTSENINDLVAAGKLRPGERLPDDITRVATARTREYLTSPITDIGSRYFRIPGTNRIIDAPAMASLIDQSNIFVKQHATRTTVIYGAAVISSILLREQGISSLLPMVVGVIEREVVIKGQKYNHLTFETAAEEKAFFKKSLKLAENKFVREVLADREERFDIYPEGTPEGERVAAVRMLGGAMHTPGTLEVITKGREIAGGTRWEYFEKTPEQIKQALIDEQLGKGIGPKVIVHYLGVPMRGGGIGKFLIDYIGAEGARVGAENIELFARYEAEPFYQATGFYHVPTSDIMSLSPSKVSKFSGVIGDLKGQHIKRIINPRSDLFNAEVLINEITEPKYRALKNIHATMLKDIVPGILGDDRGIRLSNAKLADLIYQYLDTAKRTGQDIEVMPRSEVLKNVKALRGSWENGMVSEFDVIQETIDPKKAEVRIAKETYLRTYDNMLTDLTIPNEKVIEYVKKQYEYFRKNNVPVEESLQSVLDDIKQYRKDIKADVEYEAKVARQDARLNKLLSDTTLTKDEAISGINELRGVSGQPPYTTAAERQGIYEKFLQLRDERARAGLIRLKGETPVPTEAEYPKLANPKARASALAINQAIYQKPPAPEVTYPLARIPAAAQVMQYPAVALTETYKEPALVEEKYPVVVQSYQRGTVQQVIYDVIQYPENYRVGAAPEYIPAYERVLYRPTYIPPYEPPYTPPYVPPYVPPYTPPPYIPPPYIPPYTPPPEIPPPPPPYVPPPEIPPPQIPPPPWIPKKDETKIPRKRKKGGRGYHLYTEKGAGAETAEAAFIVFGGGALISRDQPEKGTSKEPAQLVILNAIGQRHVFSEWAGGAEPDVATDIIFGRSIEQPSGETKRAPRQSETKKATQKASVIELPDVSTAILFGRPNKQIAGKKSKK